MPATRSRQLAACLALSAAFAAQPAIADDVALAGNGAWQPFTVDALLAPSATPLAWVTDAGSPLFFTFSIGAGLTGTLTVVDAGFAGDTFAVAANGRSLAATSAVPFGLYGSAHDVGLDYAAALADTSFSRGVYTFGAGSWRIGGSLLQSVLLDGQQRLDSTAGALQLVVGPVPEPETWALLVAGLAVFGVIGRRRSKEA